MKLLQLQLITFTSFNSNSQCSILILSNTSAIIYKAVCSLFWNTLIWVTVFHPNSNKNRILFGRGKSDKMNLKVSGKVKWEKSKILSKRIFLQQNNLLNVKMHSFTYSSRKFDLDTEKDTNKWNSIKSKNRPKLMIIHWQHFKSEKKKVHYSINIILTTGW